LLREGDARVLIFTNMKVTAERLERLLKANGIKAAALTGDIPQLKRTEILSSFKAGKLPVLVASDVASRGLHIEGVTHVINYDLPQDSEDYVHRIGRTARAGAEGKAISFACEDYVYALEGIEKYIKEKIPVVPVEDRLIVKNYKQPAPSSKKRFPPSSHQSRRAIRVPAGKGKRPSR
jgi:ATP-dependent RNA helicase RhlB